MTTRTLVLLRHAKAQNPDGYAQDIDRPLSKRGRSDAVAAGRWLAEAKLLPDQVLCSTSVRTRDTWLAVARATGEVPVVYEPILYLAGAAEALELIRRSTPTASTLLVIGHNPGLSVLSRRLDQAGLRDEGLKTAGIAVHQVAGVWADLAEDGARLVRCHTPRG